MAIKLPLGCRSFVRVQELVGSHIHTFQTNLAKNELNVPCQTLVFNENPLSLFKTQSTIPTIPRKIPLKNSNLIWFTIYSYISKIINNQYCKQTFELNMNTRRLLIEIKRHKDRESSEIMDKWIRLVPKNEFCFLKIKWIILKNKECFSDELAL